MKSTTRTILYFVAAVLISAALAVTVTVTVMRSTQSDTVVLTQTQYDELSNLLVIQEIMEKIKTDALDGDVSDAVLIRGAAEGMLSAIQDNYGEYYSAEEYDEYLSRLNGEYSGIGVLVGQPDGIGAAILDVYEETPAEAAGLKTGDIITMVDGDGVANLQLEELASLVSRSAGEAVMLTIDRSGEIIEVSVISDVINVKRVHYYLYNEYTGYIRIDSFTGSCADEFNEAYKDLTERGMRSLVIDLRNNPGGSLSSVVDITDVLLGNSVIVSVMGNGADTERVYRSSGSAISIPLAVLVNENSASASEILAGAVQDNGAGVIVGITTYGKGTVQTTMRLSRNGGWLKLTTDAYYTPSGANINGVGITPDVTVDLPAELKLLPIDEIDQDADVQLWAALDEVRAQANERQSGAA